MTIRVGFAGDRDIAVWVMDYLLHSGCSPVALLLSDGRRASHADELLQRCGHLEPEQVFHGAEFRSAAGIERLRAMNLDVLLSIHFPYLVPASVLDLPRMGAINLHPGFLPYNRGWHTPSWAILDGTPIGATLHFMSQEIDAGDIIHQEQLEVRPDDTAHTLYQRLKELELKVFRAAWPSIDAGKPPRTPQVDAGTTHQRQDLLKPDVQQILLDEAVCPEELLRRLRALTTDRIEEAAYFELDGRRYSIQIRIEEGEASES